MKKKFFKNNSLLLASSYFMTGFKINRDYQVLSKILQPVNLKGKFISLS